MKSLVKEDLFIQLEILNQLGWNESEELEFKSGKGGIPGSLWETYSAFANTNGGVIFLGVEDNGFVSGLENIPKIIKSFWDTINNKGKVNYNLLNNTDVIPLDNINGKTIIAIRVPRAKRNLRPVYINHSPFDGTYRRHSEGDYLCTPEEVKRMFADSDIESADNKVLESYTLNDLDLTSLHQYRQRVASHTPNHPWLIVDDKTFLTKIGGWHSSRAGEIEGITIAGLLMFGKEESIQERLPKYQVDYREKLSENPQVRWTDRVTLDGTWTGNLFQFYLKVVQKLSSDLKLPFQLDDDLFRKGESNVHIAIREALVNALIHADYQGSGGIVINKYYDRFEFSNPGSLLISFEQLLNGNISECRNPYLQKMFLLMGAAEKAGSGVDKILSGWKSQYWRLPRIKEQVRPDRVIWILPMVSLIPEESLIRLQNHFGQKFQKCNSYEVQALVTIDLEGDVDNARLQQITNLHPVDITKLLQGLVRQGFLQQIGQKRGAQYTLMPHDLSIIPQHNSHIPHDPSIIPHEDVENRILQYCLDCWKTKKDLGELLNRDPKHLSNRYLSPLIKKGRLRLLYPDKKTSKGQAYQTIQK